MSNTFTYLQPILFEAAQRVSREPVGALGAITTNFSSQVAVGDSVRIPIAPTRSSSTYSPAMTTTAGTDTSDDNVTLQLTANEFVDWHLTGEQMRSLSNAGMLNEWLRQMAAQGVRKLANNMESLVCTTAKKGASRAYGTAGTTPFGTAADLSDAANVYKILLDNGAPRDGISLIIDSAAGLKLRGTQTSLFKANEAGSDAMLRQGILGNLFGMQVRESGQVTTHTKGTGSGYLINNASGYAIGSKALTVDTGTGTIVQGDVITLAGPSTNKYVVNSALASNIVTVGRPGLKVAVVDNDTVTVGNNYTANFACQRDSIVLAARPPVIPSAPQIKQTIVGDPESGLSFLFCEVVGDGMITWRLHVAYGAAVVQSEHVALLLG